MSRTTRKSMKIINHHRHASYNDRSTITTAYERRSLKLRACNNCDCCDHKTEEYYNIKSGQGDWDNNQ